MRSTLINAIVQIIEGIVGGNAADAATEHGLRIILINTIAGAFAGGIGGFFLHGMVNGSGEPNFDGSPADDLVMRGLAGFLAGGLLAMIFSVLNIIKDEHINSK